MNDTEDRKHTKIPKHGDKAEANSNQKQSALQHFLQNANLIDTWRLFNPGEKSSTQYSHVHGSFSRIDHLLIPPSLIKKMDNADITEISITDHTLITLSLKMDQERTKNKMWKFPTLKNNTLFHTYLKESWEEFITNNNLYKYSPTLLWESSKAYMRGRIIAYTTAYKRKIKYASQEAVKPLQIKQQECKNNPSQRAKKKKIEAKNYYNIKADEVEMIHKDNRDLLLHRFGNKPGKLLSYLTKEHYTPIFITKMRKLDGTKTSDTQDISEVFETYYKTL